MTVRQPMPINVQGKDSIEGKVEWRLSTTPFVHSSRLASLRLALALTMNQKRRPKQMRISQTKHRIPHKIPRRESGQFPALCRVSKHFICSQHAVLFAPHHVYAAQQDPRCENERDDAGAPVDLAGFGERGVVGPAQAAGEGVGECHEGLAREGC